MSAGDSKTEACAQIVSAIHQILAQRSPVLVAIDGGSGAGKSTIASRLAQELDGVIVPLDDFYAADIPDLEWDARSTSARLSDVFDWERLRLEALAPLLDQQPARWYPFDFESGMRPDGTYAISPHPVERQPAPVILLEGAYSASPQMADLIDLKVLIDLPVPERHRRLAEREHDQQFLQRWHAIWDGVEAYYFSEVMPQSAFDIVLPG